MSWSTTRRNTLRASMATFAAVIAGCLGDERDPYEMGEAFAVEEWDLSVRVEDTETITYRNGGVTSPGDLYLEGTYTYVEISLENVGEEPVTVRPESFLLVDGETEYEYDRQVTRELDEGLFPSRELPPDRERRRWIGFEVPENPDSPLLKLTTDSSEYFVSLE